MAAGTALKGQNAVTEIGVSAMMDLEKLSKWINESRIDPNDPANAHLVYLLRVSLHIDVCLRILQSTR